MLVRVFEWGRLRVFLEKLIIKVEVVIILGVFIIF